MYKLKGKHVSTTSRKHLETTCTDFKGHVETQCIYKFKGNFGNNVNTNQGKIGETCTTYVKVWKRVNKTKRTFGNHEVFNNVF